MRGHTWLLAFLPAGMLLQPSFFARGLERAPGRLALRAGESQHALSDDRVRSEWLGAGAAFAPTSTQNPEAPSPAPKAAAPIDLTGYWVSIVTEDWRYRMVTPAKGDYQAVPMNAAARKVADGWDPAADEAAGNQCKSYGAAAIMRVPGRAHITWADDRTLRLEVDAGTQARLFRFDESPAGDASWQGDSVAQWERPGGRGGAGRGGAADAAPPKGGSLKVVTKNMRAGYLRKNGVPYSEKAVLTEYFDVAPQRNGAQVLVVTAIVDDPTYLTQSFVVSSQFRKQADAKGWEPTPCSATW